MKKNNSVIPNLSLSHIIYPMLAYYYFFFFLLFRATPMAYGSSQARGQIRATAAGLCHSHSNAGSKPCLQPTPQLPAMPDP